MGLSVSMSPSHMRDNRVIICKRTAHNFQEKNDRRKNTQNTVKKSCDSRKHFTQFHIAERCTSSIAVAAANTKVTLRRHSSIPHVQMFVILLGEYERSWTFPPSYHHMKQCDDPITGIVFRLEEEPRPARHTGSCVHVDNLFQQLHKILYNTRLHNTMVLSGEVIHLRKINCPPLSCLPRDKVDNMEDLGKKRGSG